MALVSYDNSSDSENENDSNVILNKINLNHNDSQVMQFNSTAELFSNLPPTKELYLSAQIYEENDKLEYFIPTVKMMKEKQKVKIFVPSLSEFKDPADEEPLKKRVKLLQKGSGLLGILPPVQNAPLSTTSFIPNTVKNKNVSLKTSLPKGDMIPHSVRKIVESQKVQNFVENENKMGSDNESDDDAIKIPDTFDDQMWEKVCGRPKPKPSIEVDITNKVVTLETVNLAPEPERPYNGLDNKAFKELVGKSSKSIGNIRLIDINEEEIMPNKDLWMTKSLTDPEMAPKTHVEDWVDPTRKRKHHITYLAQQAKANEQELKTAWGASRSNRMMSRAKYGF